MSDQDPTHRLPAPEQPPPGPRRLRRSRSDRVLGGVAGGLGDYFNVDPLIFRIGFAVSVFFGGLGVIAYLALLIFVPSEPADAEAGPPPERSRGGTIAAAAGLGLLLLVFGLPQLISDGDDGWWFDGPFFLGGPIFLIALVAAAFYLLRRDGDERTSSRGILATVAIVLVSAAALCSLAVLAAWAGATGSGEVVAAVIIAIGVLLALAAFRGGARWLIAPALALAVPLGAVAAADVSFEGGVGEREYDPAAASAIPAEGYQLGVGRMAVDLRNLEWRDATVLRLPLDLGVGEAVIAVPESVCVTGSIETSVGAVEVGGDEDGGIDVQKTPNAGTEATPRLELDAQADLGAIRVLNDDGADLDDHDRGPFDHDDEGDRDQMSAAMERACAPEPDPRSGKEGS